MTVYVFEAEGLDRFKIGHSINVEKRLAGSQTSCPVRLIVLGTMSGDLEDEARVHARFAHLRLHGEWFRGAPDLYSFAASLTPYTPRDRHPTWPCTKGPPRSIAAQTKRFRCAGCGATFERMAFAWKAPKYCARSCANRNRNRVATGSTPLQ